jgi:hypothetical protein
MSDDKRDELGALWEQTNSRGTYLSGTINGVRVVAFKNDKKVAGDKQPVYRVLRAKARDEDTGPRETVQIVEDEEPPF